MPRREPTGLLVQRPVEEDFITTPGGRGNGRIPLLVAGGQLPHRAEELLASGDPIGLLGQKEQDNSIL